MIEPYYNCQASIQEQAMFENEKIIFALLQKQESIQIDQLHFKSGLSTGLVAEALLSLEMQGIILSIPGKVFKLA
jgi:DNA processing protein